MYGRAMRLVALRLIVDKEDWEFFFNMEAPPWDWMFECLLKSIPDWTKCGKEDTSGQLIYNVVPMSSQWRVYGK